MGLALLALFVQVLAPPGFMVERQGGRTTIVLCTGHGPVLTLSDLTGHPTKTPKSKPDAPCAFAGHGAAAAPPMVAFIGRPLERAGDASGPARLDLAPGRGLAAPPPPSQGPPGRIL